MFYNVHVSLIITRRKIVQIYTVCMHAGVGFGNLNYAYLPNYLILYHIHMHACVVLHVYHSIFFFLMNVYHSI